MTAVLAIDVGSTYTKLTAIDVNKEMILATSKSFTTIESDVCIGYNNALSILEQQTGKLSYTKKFASSSAAGGLKMIACGFVPDLTVKASKMAAFSAGAKVIKSYSYELNKREQEEIAKQAPDIILLSGGIDGGNKDNIIHNAHVLAEINQELVVIVAGNKVVSHDVEDILRRGNKTCIICENVMPELNTLNIAPTKDVIRDLFIERIIHAKGLDKLQEMLDDQIIPTPLSVFNAIELLSLGTKTEKGFGEIMSLDVGGATTDVYSMSYGYPTKHVAAVRGLKEPYAKRSVEGDIGVRYSLPSLIETTSLEDISYTTGIAAGLIQEWIDKCIFNPEILPKTDVEKCLDAEFASIAVHVSMDRHCGTLEKGYTVDGEILVQTGKDLSNIKYIIATGGSVINSINPKKIIQRSLKLPQDFELLKPISPSLLLDKSYIISAMGLLSKDYKDTALRIMKKELQEL